MKKLYTAVALASAALCAMFFAPSIGGQALDVVYGPTGLQRLSYGGVTLEDTARYSADAFHIWHLKMTSLQGGPVSGSQYGWGESNAGKSWDAVAHRWTYNFIWGSISVQYVVSGNQLDIITTETNLPTSGVILAGATIYPLALHFPQLPANFNDASYPQLSYTTTSPGVITADYGSGETVAVAPEAAKPLYSGFWPTGDANTYTALISSTTPDNLASFQPHFDRPVQPGQSDTFTVSYRFAASGTSAIALAADAYSNYAKTFPNELSWPDRRPLGTIYLASSPTSGAVNMPNGFPNNPRRYFNDSDASHFDVRTTAGLQAFQNLVLQRAQENVANLQALGAQGAIVWDIEGEQYPQATTYVCSPDQIAQVAPEMDSTITSAASPYRGQKLDDVYFKTLTAAGFRVGVCVRPQHFAIAADGTATQTTLSSSADVRAELARKIQYAHDRWGATLFYVDSSVDANGGALDPVIFQQLHQQFPDSLLIPEESTLRHYAYTAPFQTFLFHADTGTDPAVRAVYPTAFSNILINDVNPATLAAARAKLTASVKAGDTLMGHADYPDQNNATIVSIEKDAGQGTTVTVTEPTPTTPPAPVTTPTPVQTATVAILSPSSGATVNGVVAVQGAVSVNLDPAGSYLMVDGKEFGTARVTGAPYNYPLDTTLLSNGAHTLQLWAHDTGNAVSLSTTVQVTVNNAAAIPVTTPVTTTPVTTVPVTTVPVTTTPSPVVSTAPVSITYPASGQAVSGAIAVNAAVQAQLDAAGSILLVDGAQFGTDRVWSAPYTYSLNTAALSTGTHVLQVWAHTTGNATLLSDPVSVKVTR